jgi:DNA-binding MarR family transcriptional regulator
MTDGAVTERAGEPEQPGPLGHVVPVASGRDAADVHRFFWYWFEWVRSPSRRRQTEDMTGLPLSASMILWQLIFHGPLSVSEIARKLGLQRSTVSRQLQPLRDRRFVSETPGRHNKKVSEVSIAPAGEAVCAQLEGLYLDYWTRIVNRLDAAQQRRLTAALEDLRHAMDAEADADPTGFARLPWA